MDAVLIDPNVIESDSMQQMMDSVGALVAYFHDWRNRRHSTAGASHRLAAAIAEEACHDLKSPCATRVRDAWAYIESAENRYLYSFANICAVFRINVGAARSALWKRHQKHIVWAQRQRGGPTARERHRALRKRREVSSIPCGNGEVKP